MIEPKHAEMSIVRQCELVSISRSSWYYEAKSESAYCCESIFDAERR